MRFCCCCAVFAATDKRRKRKLTSESNAWPMYVALRWMGKWVKLLYRTDVRGRAKAIWQIEGCCLQSQQKLHDEMVYIELHDKTKKEEK